MSTLPHALLNSLKGLPGFSIEQFIQAHSAETVPVSIRFNPFKPPQPVTENSTSVPWSNNAIYLPQRPYFTHDPLFHAGSYYVQEASSMFIAEVMKQTLDLSEELKVLDACAAPGGKSTLINSLLTPQSLLVANEIIKSRSEILSQNLGRWGTSNTIVTNNSPEKFTTLSSYFDCIVVDAPCSGSGLFRKQPEAIAEWSPEAVTACGVRQKDILSQVLPSLKNNGVLIYSTCSYSVEENENIVEWLVNQRQMELLPLSVNKEWGLVQSDFGIRFYPHLVNSEGFFCAALRKKTGEGESKFKSRAPQPASKNELQIIAPFLSENNGAVCRLGQHFHLLNPTAFNFYGAFAGQFYFRKAGTEIGEIKGQDLVPSQQLAWSINVSTNVQGLELDLENAIAYLKKQSFTTTLGLSGLVLVKYKNQGLGWAKILPNRANNYLPNELRILK